MAEFRSAVVTDLGAELLARSVAEGFKVEFVRLEIGCGIYDEDEKKKEALQQRTGLKEKQQEIGFSNISVTDENAVMLKAVVSNEALETGYYMTEMGIIAKKEGAEDEVLYSVMIAEVQDFMPGKENPMEVIQEYHSKITNAENVVINVEQGAYATAEDMQSVLKPQFKENEEIENIESGESIFSIFAKIKRAIRGLIEHKTSGDHDSRYYTEVEMDGKLSGKSDTTHNHDGRYLQKSAVINSNTVTEAGYALDARQANPNVSGSLGAQISSLNRTFTQRISELNTNLNNKSDNGHTHDDRYYTEYEIDSKFNQINNVSTIRLGGWGVLYKIGKIVVLHVDANIGIDINMHTWDETIPDGYKPIWGVRASGDITFSSKRGGGSFCIFIDTKGIVTFVSHLEYDSSKGYYIYGAQVTWITS